MVASHRQIMDMINGLSSSDQELVMCLTREWIGQKHAKNDDVYVCVCTHDPASSIEPELYSSVDRHATDLLSWIMAESMGLQVFFFCTWMLSLTYGFSYRNQTLLSHHLHHFFQLKNC